MKKVKFKVSKQDLLDQIGDTERVILKRYNLPDFYVFDGISMEDHDVDGYKLNRNALKYLKEYPELINLSKIEFKIFCDLLSSEQGVHWSQLTQYLTNPQTIMGANTICVHIKNIRNKLKGFKIETVRSPFNPPGGTYKAFIK